MIKLINKDSKLVAYIRKHKKLMGVSKKTVGFYTEYKIEGKNK